MDTPGLMQNPKECKMSKQNGVKSKVREIRRKTRKRYSSEEKIRIVLEGLRGEGLEGVSEFFFRFLEEGLLFL